MESESEANSSLVSSVLIIQNLLERSLNIIYTVIIGSVVPQTLLVNG